MEDLESFCAEVSARSPGAEVFIRGFIARVIEHWLIDLDNLLQLCISTLPRGKGEAMVNFVRHTAEKGIQFAPFRQSTNLGPLDFYWTTPRCVPPSVLPVEVDYGRLPKDLRTRIESVINLVSDLPVPIEPYHALEASYHNDPWDKNLPPSFSQWRARLSFIGDSL